MFTLLAAPGVRLPVRSAIAFHGCAQRLSTGAGPSFGGAGPDLSKMRKLVEAIKNGDVEAAQLEHKKALEARTLWRDKLLIRSGAVLSGIALFCAVRLNQRARIHEDERAELSAKMYGQIEEAERKRERLLKALPALATGAAGLSAEKAEELGEAARRESS